MEEVAQYLNSCDLNAFKGGLTAALALLLQGNASPSSDDEQHIGDAIAQLLVEGVRRGFNSSEMLDFLSATTLQSKMIDVIVEAYTANLNELVAALVTPAEAMQSFEPALVGVRWTSGHCLGNRLVDPPHRSLPYITVAFETLNPSTGRPETVSMTCSTEEAQDLLSKLKGALHEAELISGAKLDSKKKGP